MADVAHQERRRRGPLLDRARREIAEGRPWRARAHLQTLLQRDQAQDEARALLVDTLLAMDDRAGAERVAGHVLPGGTALAKQREPMSLRRMLTYPVELVAATVVVLGFGAVVVIPFALFGIGLYQLGAWGSLW